MQPRQSCVYYSEVDEFRVVPPPDMEEEVGGKLTHARISSPPTVNGGGAVTTTGKSFGKRRQGKRGGGAAEMKWWCTSKRTGGQAQTRQVPRPARPVAGDMSQSILTNKKSPNHCEGKLILNQLILHLHHLYSTHEKKYIFN